MTLVINQLITILTNIKSKEIDYYETLIFLNVEENAPFLSQDEFHTIFSNEPRLYM